MSNNMKLAYVGLVAFALLGWFGMDSLIDADNDAMKRESYRQNEIKSHVGEKIVIDGDTSTIIDVDFWDSNYKLSNGTEVDFSFVKHEPL